MTNTENPQWIKLQILHDNVYNQDIRTDPDGQIMETFLHGQIIKVCKNRPPPTLPNPAYLFH